MNSDHANNKQGSQLESDYGWRHFKVRYITISIVAILIVFIAILISNQQITCETYTPRFTLNKSEVASSCLSASARGDGISMAILLIPAIIAIVGYKLLPKLYIYLKSNNKDNKIS